MVARVRPVRELRAFDWVDFVLYLLATAGFVAPTLSLLTTGEIPSFLLADREAGIFPNLQGEEIQSWYKATAVAFGFFVVFVYLRNYLMMHRIDDRRDGHHYEFFFVDYNINGWNQTERLVRAAIVLWVLTTTIGAVPPVTSTIHGVIEEIVGRTIGFPSYDNLSFMQGFFTYYGFVILVLFILFVVWDVVNIWSIGRQIKSGCFANRTLGPSAAFNATARARNFEAAFPVTLANAVPVYALVSYIRPRVRTFGQADQDTEVFDCWSRVRQEIERGQLLRLYLKGGAKFVERLVGILIGGLLFLSPFLSGNGLIYQTVTVLIALGIYITVLHTELLPTLRDARNLFLDYLVFRSTSWEPTPGPPPPATSPPPPLTEENAR